MNSWNVSFQVTEQLVDAFARLTGDYNSLHINEQYARFYSYRERVVHGMLPVSAFSLLEPFRSLVIKKISGRFIYPVYLGDTVMLELTQEQEDDQTIEGQKFSFNVRTSSMREPVTYGEIILGPVSLKASSVLSVSKNRSFLKDSVEENTLEFSDIVKGHSETLAFTTVSGGFVAWLKELRKYTVGETENRNNLPCSYEMIAVMLCSTMVGMRLPGRRAIFLNFSLEFIQSLQSDINYVLQGTVDFISVSTSIIAEKIEILNMLKGKISVKMDEPTKAPPSLKDLSHQKMDSSLQEKVVIITGASRGIGATTARLFASQGAHVVINYLNSESQANDLVKEIECHEGRALAVKADVSKREQVQSMIARTVSTFGCVDVLVNNAVTDYLTIPFQSLIWEKIQKDIDVIVQGAFHCSQEVIPHMIKKGGGRIINVVTMATEIPPVGHSKYVIAKSALIGLTRSLAVEFAGHNILVNMVMPSMVETDLTKNIPTAVRDRIGGSNPLGRHPTTVDVAKAIVTLAGSNFSYTTGQKFFVTGGLPPFV